MDQNSIFQFSISKHLPEATRPWGNFRESVWVVTIALLMLLPGGLPAQSRQPQPPSQLPPLEILQRAHTLFAEGDYVDARKYYLQALPSFPDNFDILKDLAYCYYATGPRGYSQAAVYYARAYAINPRSSEVADKLTQCYMTLKRYDEAAAVSLKLAQLPNAPAEAWRKAAEAYEAAHESSKAENAYIAYLQRNPGDLLARSNLARLYSWQKDYRKALDQYRMVLSANPNFSPALIGMARILSWQGQLDRSLELYDRVLRFEPHNGEAESGKAFILLWQGQNQDALALFTKLHERYPRDAEVAQGLEIARTGAEEKAFLAAKKAGDTTQIVAYYRERLAKNPKDLAALKAMMSFNANAKRCQESIAFGHKALQLSQGDPDVELALARSLTRCQDYTEAIARYRHYLESHPGAEGALYELGDTLLRARRAPEAVAAFQKLLSINPNNLDGEIGLAQALSATGQYDKALAEFNQTLRQSPDNYDALQGKGYILYYRNDFEQAKAIFRDLAEKNPSDAQNSQALRDIATAEEQARWAALRPPIDAPPQAWKKFYEKRLASYPSDRDALKGLAYVEAELNNAPAAIQGYRRVLALYPEDRDAKLELARLLGLNGQYLASINLYRDVLQSSPDDPKVLDSLARVYVWAGENRQALEIYQRLLAANPSNTGYQLEVGRLEVNLKEYPAAKNALATVLTQDPQNHEARLEIARLDFSQGEMDSSLKNFEILLKDNPNDPDALFGKAQIDYRQGRLPQAEVSARRAIETRPKNFSSLFLMASIEHARHHRRQALQVLEEADKLSPGNPEATALKKQILSESAVTIHTTASYAREIGPPSESGSRSGLPNEDLRMFTYGTTIGLFLLPRTDSYLSFTALPADSPLGPLRDSFGNQIPTGISGAAVPEVFLYRQTTRLTSHLALRSGVGLVRFGPGALVPVPGQPQPIISAKSRPLGLAGLSYSPTRKLSFDLDYDRSPVTYTPVASRFGVVEDRIQGRLNYFFDPRTELHLAYWYGNFSTASFNHVSTVNGVQTLTNQADHDHANGGIFQFNRNFYRSERFSFDGGYQGAIFGFANAGKLFLGFFNPDRYQIHELAPRIYGKLWGPLGYDFSGGIGIQQSGTGKAIRRAWSASPAFSLQVSRRLLLTLRYTHYNTAQALGPLRGNAVALSTDWKF